MFIQRLPKNLQDNLALLGKSLTTRNFYLAGGTAAALWLGHRISVDLDFFTPHRFDVKGLKKGLEKIGNVVIEDESEDTLNGRLNDLKVSFFLYPYPLLNPCERFQGVEIADLIDIACMKIDAISSRGTKRDFIDLYFICMKARSLRDLLYSFDKKYEGTGYNKIHIIKSLTYFRDAENQEMPKMLLPVDWEEVTDFFEKEIGKIGREILNI